jgi:hypothetical protein
MKYSYFWGVRVGWWGRERGILKYNGDIGMEQANQNTNDYFIISK